MVALVIKNGRDKNMINFIKKYWTYIILTIAVSLFGGFCFTCKVTFTPENLLNAGLWIGSFIGAYTISGTIKIFSEKLLPIKKSNDYLVYLFTFTCTTVITGIITFNYVPFSSNEVWYKFAFGTIASLFACLTGIALLIYYKFKRQEKIKTKTIKLSKKLDSETKSKLIEYKNLVTMNKDIFYALHPNDNYDEYIKRCNNMIKSTDNN